MLSVLKQYRQTCLIFLFRLCDFSAGAISLDKEKKLFMRRPTLDNLPRRGTLPKEYSLHVATLSHCKGISEVLKKAYSPFWPQFRVKYILFDAEDVVKTFVIMYKGKPVANASARFDPRAYPHSGYLHWVAVDPDHRGKGLGYAVSLAILEYFQKAKYADAVLETDPARIPAISLYSKLGFKPEYKFPSQKKLWEEVLKRVKK